METDMMKQIATQEQEVADREWILKDKDKEIQNIVI